MKWFLIWCFAGTMIADPQHSERACRKMAAHHTRLGYPAKCAFTTEANIRGIGQ